MTVRLFIDNLPATIAEEDLERMFSVFGTIEYLYLSGEWEAPREKRFGFVDMARKSEAETAMESLHNSIVGGKKISVMISRQSAKAS